MCWCSRRVYDPGWVGAVVGQITNDHPTKLLSSATVFTVVFDASGAVLGGGKGYSSAGGMLPGVRAYFSASSGVSPIPIDRAASAGVTVLAQYEADRLVGGHRLASRQRGARGLSRAVA